VSEPEEIVAESETLEREAAYSSPTPRVTRFDHGSPVPAWDKAFDLERDPPVFPDRDTPRAPG